MAITVDRALFQGLYDQVFLVKATVDPASLATGSANSTTVTVAGVALGDHVISYAAGVSTANLVAEVNVTAANTLTIRLDNNTGGTVDLAASTWTFLIGRPSGRFV